MRTFSLIVLPAAEPCRCIWPYGQQCQLASNARCCAAMGSLARQDQWEASRSQASMFANLQTLHVQQHNCAKDSLLAVIMTDAVNVHLRKAAHSLLLELVTADPTQASQCPNQNCQQASLEFNQKPCFACSHYRLELPCGT